MKKYLYITLILVVTIPIKTQKTEYHKLRKYVTASKLFVREKPSRDSKILGNLYKGDFPEIISASGIKEKINGVEAEWIFINYNIKGYVFSNYLSDDPPFLLDDDELDQLGKENFKKFASLFYRNINREPTDGLDSYEHAEYMHMFSEIETLSNINFIKSKKISYELENWIIKNNKEIELLLDRGNCTFQFEAVLNADKGCTFYKIELIKEIQNSGSLDRRDAINYLNDDYCITAFENGVDTCGRSSVGNSLYESLK